MENEFSFRTRELELASLERDYFEVAIIGGGITGAGIANILAENNIKTVLFEKNDFASGTSSGSSKLIHGGLRYLQQGRIFEVRRLLKERDYLLKNVDIVKTLNFDILIGKSMWNKYKIKFGLFLYNLLAGKFEIPKYNHNVRYNKNISGYYTYSDGITVDSKLVIYNIVSAKKHGCKCFNYCEVVGINKLSDNISLSVNDANSGKTTMVKSRILINASGPWALNIARKFNIKPDISMKLSMGIHIVLPREKYPAENAIVFRSIIDGRQLFLIPTGEIIYIGTTDKFVDSPEYKNVENEDINYLIKSAEYITGHIDINDILFSFSGIRPLIGKSKDPGKISRDFHISVNENIINVLGGKLTDYRYASRKVARKVGRILNKKITIRNYPYIDYARGKHGDMIKYEIYHECPMKPDDILRRRDAFRIYCPHKVDSMEKQIIDEMRGEGMQI